MTRIFRRLAVLGLAVLLALGSVIPVSAITQEEIDEMKEEQARLEKEMEDIEADLAYLERREDSALEQALLYQQQMGVLTQQINATKAIIADYDAQIAQTELELEEAIAREEEYYLLFCDRVRDMEEAGGLSYWSILFDATSFSDFLDRMGFIREVIAYDIQIAEDLEQARLDVVETQARLEEERAGQQAALEELERQQNDLQIASDKNDALLAEIRSNQAAYQDRLDDMEEASEELAEDIVESEAEYEEQLRRLEEEAARNNININGHGTGAQVAAYGCQFIGNPYVWGGNSLTNGCDCSGFVQQVYKYFGYSVPRSSWAQRYCGTVVSYADAQPGDIIFYQSSASASGGHVGIYIGDGKMVNALGAKWGIVISNVNSSRPGFTVCRVINS